MMGKQEITKRFNLIYLKNFRRGLATNSSSTHSVIYKNDGEIMEDVGVFEEDFFSRFTSTVASTREAKIKYILANIMYDETLVEVMTGFYPEMKKYFPKIRKQIESEEKNDYDEIFGVVERGSLTDNNNLEFNVSYLRNIIDNDDIAIVGGSDEMDFVYETCEGHSYEPMAIDSKYESPYKQSKSAIVKNGNYWIAFGRTNRWYSDEDVQGMNIPPKFKNSYDGRLRFSTSPDEPVPEYPELIDIRITNRCENGCPFCFMDSKKNERDADFDFLQTVVRSLRVRTEFSIGGGNVLLYPKFGEFVKMLSDNGHIVNVTIHAKNVRDVLDNTEMREVFNNYVDGIGISVFDDDDINSFVEFCKAFTGDPDTNKHIVAHMIPELIGVGMTKKIIERTSGVYCGYLFLGYKTNGRGSNVYHRVLTDGELETLFETTLRTCSSTSIDTTFGRRYEKFIKTHLSWKYSITLNEGEYSMYVDGVNGYASKSSYETDKKYNLIFCRNGDFTDKWYRLNDAFSEIRKDGGFELYEDVKKKSHYYDPKRKTTKKKNKKYNARSSSVRN